MHQADASGINPDVAAIPMSKREAIWKGDRVVFQKCTP